MTKPVKRPRTIQGVSGQVPSNKMRPRRLGTAGKGIGRKPKETPDGPFARSGVQPHEWADMEQ